MMRSPFFFPFPLSVRKQTRANCAAKQKERRSKNESALFLFMPPTGVEPVLCLQKGILSPSCLPVPPRRPSMPPLRGPNDSFYNTIVSALCQEKTVRLTGYPAKETFLPGMDKTKKMERPAPQPEQDTPFLVFTCKNYTLPPWSSAYIFARQSATAGVILT